jgi:hypothetical protein
MKNLTALLVLMLVSGCASFTGERPEARITVERVGSVRAGIGVVTLAGGATSLIVHGTVTRRPENRGTLRGYVRIEAFDANGGVVYAVDAVYRNMSLKARSARFSGVLAVAAERVKRGRVTDSFVADE